MAVQKSRVTRSRRGQRRSHDSLTKAKLSKDSATGEFHYRHHLTPSGSYRGVQYFKPNRREDDTKSSAK